jgi:hypothetical protein
LFGEGDFTCFVTRFTGTFAAPLRQPDGTVIEPTGEAFNVFETVVLDTPAPRAIMALERAGLYLSSR